MKVHGMQWDTSTRKGGSRMSEHRVKIQVKTGGEVRQLKVKLGENLMEALHRHGLTLPHPCNGKGKCGKCHVRISAWGEQADKTSLQAKEFTRLACMTVVKEPVSVHVGPKVNTGLRDKSLATKKTRNKESSQLAKQPNKESSQLAKQPNQEFFPLAKQPNKNPSPPFHRTCAVITGTDASEGSLWARLIAGFAGKDRKSLEWDRERVLPLLQDILPASGGPVTLTRAGKRFFSLEAGDTTQHRLGIAFYVSDESLSAVMARLDDGMSLESASRKLLKSSSADPGTHEGNVLISVMNGLVEALCTQSGKQASDISDAVMTGSSSVLYAMTKLIMKEADLAAWVRDQHPPVIPSQQWVRADTLGLGLGRHAGVWLPPAVSAVHGPGKDAFESAWMADSLSCLLDGRSRKEAEKRAKKQTKAGK